MNNKLSSLISLIIKKTPKLGKTKLVKLIYLIDYEHFKAFGKSITGIEYFYHFYGPYSDDISKSIKELNQLKVILEQKNVSVSGRPYCSYHLLKEFNYYKFLDEEEMETVNYIVQKYGNEELDILLDEVYDTKPMKKVKTQGEVLDFKEDNKDILNNISFLKKKIKPINSSNLIEEDIGIPSIILSLQTIIASEE